MSIVISTPGSTPRLSRFRRSRRTRRAAGRSCSMPCAHSHRRRAARRLSCALDRTPMRVAPKPKSPRGGARMYADLVTVSDWRRALALATFVASYVGLGLGRVPGLRVDRTGVAIIGAAVMVVSGAVPWADAVVAVDAPTLVLLFGMMIVTAYLRLSGFFGLVMTWALRRARTPLALLAAVVVASGVLSAFFVNDVVCLVLAPVVLQATRELALPPVPYLVALATAANVGSVATLTGNPQNMLVGSFSGISYR